MWIKLKKICCEKRNFLCKKNIKVYNHFSDQYIYLFFFANIKNIKKKIIFLNKKSK